MAPPGWYAIRALRASPPLLAGVDPQRRAVFASALQQAEELFAAAATVGPASKPLPLFYALSQAGRAVAAARDEGDAWRIRGHGLSCKLDTTGGDVREAILTPKPAKGGCDAFAAVSRAVASPALTGPVRLGDLWAALPELSRLAGMAAGDPVLEVAQPYESMPAKLQSVLAAAHGWVRLPADDIDDAEALLARYVNTRDCRVSAVSETDASGRLTVDLDWPAPPSSEATPGTRAVRALSSVAENHDGAWYLIPKLAGGDQPVARLMRWWLLLFGLSSVARYHPEAWTSTLDVDAAPGAVDLERGLDGAAEAVIELLRMALV